MTYGVYRVIGKRQYRGHDPGVEFEAVADAAIQRAIDRRDIRLLHHVNPSVQEGSIRAPEDWAITVTNRGAERRLTRSEGG